MSAFYPRTEKIFYITGQRYSDTKLYLVMLKRKRPLDFILPFSEGMQGYLHRRPAERTVMTAYNVKEAT